MLPLRGLVGNHLSLANVLQGPSNGGSAGEAHLQCHEVKEGQDFAVALRVVAPLTLTYSQGPPRTSI